jgi:rhamnosyltransferase
MTTNTASNQKSDANIGKFEKIGIVIPVYNGGKTWISCAEKINKYKGAAHVLVVDSGSTDGSYQIAVDHGFECLSILKKDFDHGGTRNLALNYMKDSCDIIIFLTQDAVLADASALTNLVSVFVESEKDKKDKKDKRISVAYGRQFPRLSAGAIESHARLLNYGEHAYTRTLDDVPVFHMKAAFTSDSFAAYRVDDLLDVGGFPEKIICGEDMVAAARMIQKGRSVAYVSTAQVYHSHNYSWLQESRRYFDVGVMHHEQHWLLEDFGKPEGEGLRFLKSEWIYLWRNSKKDIPSSIIRTFLKYGGYRAGRSYRSIPSSIRKHLSMNTGYWNNV